MDLLDGLVERITYYNAENGYTVLRLNARGVPNADLVTVVGTLPEITPGESLRLQGQWITNAQYGKQFKAEKCEQVLPATIEGLKKYLGSGLIKGVGPVTATRIVKKFGTGNAGRARSFSGAHPRACWASVPSAPPPSPAPGMSRNRSSR